MLNFIRPKITSFTVPVCMLRHSRKAFDDFCTHGGGLLIVHYSLHYTTFSLQYMFENLALNLCTLFFFLLFVLYYYVLCIFSITTWSQASVLESELQFSSTSFSYEVSSAFQQNLEVCPDFCKAIWSFAGGKRLHLQHIDVHGEERPEKPMSLKKES